MAFDPKKYSLEQLENWIHDAMCSEEVTPKEIYDVIVGVVKENYYCYKHQTSQAYELLALLNGNGEQDDIEAYNSVISEKNYYESSQDDLKAWDNFFSSNTESYTDEELDAMCDSVDYIAAEEQEKKKTWSVPIEEDESGECVITLPDELIKIVRWKENDIVEWTDNKDGSYTLKRVIK